MGQNEVEKAARDAGYSYDYIGAFKAGAEWQKEQCLKSDNDPDNQYLPGRLDFYRKEMQKIREYIEEKNIGLPSQSFFDVMYDYIKQLEENQTPIT